MAWRAGLTQPFGALLLLLSGLLALALVAVPLLDPWSGRIPWILAAGFGAYAACALISARWGWSSVEARAIRATRHRVGRRIEERAAAASGNTRTQLEARAARALARIDEEILPPFLGLVGHNIELKQQLETYSARVPAPDPTSLARLREIYAHRRAATERCVQRTVDAETQLLALLQERDDRVLAGELDLWIERLQDISAELANALVLPAVPRQEADDVGGGGEVQKAHGPWPDEVEPEAVPRSVAVGADGTPRPTEPDPRMPALPDAEFVELVDQAIKQLNKPTHLAKSDLAARVPRSIAGVRLQWGQTDSGEATSLEEAQALRQLLVDAIERLKPADSESSPRALQYHVLHKKYVLGQDVKHVVIRHSISESTFFRERLSAVRAVADDLWQQERRLVPARGRDPVALDYLG